MSARTIKPWETYPCELLFSIAEAEQRVRYQTLQGEAARIFAARDDVEIWKADSGETICRYFGGEGVNS